jgi:flagellar protein FliO/FliZ
MSGTGLTIALTAFAAAGCVAVIGWLALAAVRRVGRSERDRGETLEFVCALPLGPRERVALIAHRDELYMIGVASGAVSLLTQMPRASRPSAPAPAASAPEP